MQTQSAIREIAASLAPSGPASREFTGNFIDSRLRNKLKIDAAIWAAQRRVHEFPDEGPNPILEGFNFKVLRTRKGCLPAGRDQSASSNSFIDRPDFPRRLARPRGRSRNNEPKAARSGSAGLDFTLRSGLI
jgi:hypothetical protein